MSRRNVGHGEGSEDNWVLVMVGVGSGHNLILRMWLRVGQCRCGDSQEDVLR